MYVGELRVLTMVEVKELKELNKRKQELIKELDIIETEINNFIKTKKYIKS